MPTATSKTAPVPARREPTPDHPPYSWMIGEAIEALRGSASEEVISAFILGRHRGVPRAHDELLRHYLAKHVAQGLFVRTEEGRYSRGSRGAQQVTVAYHGRRQQQPPELALVVANVGEEDDDAATAADVDRDRACTKAPTAADGTEHTSRRSRHCSAAPVHSPATASSDANVEKMKKPRDRVRQRKVQDLYDGRSVALPPKRLLPPASNVPADAGNEMWCVLALPAPGMP